ncbi:MAG: HAD-IIIA family hydrolase [Bacteroidota bacterium]
MVTKWKIDSSWSLFLDRDGVINERIQNGYVLDYKDFSFTTGSLAAIKKFSSIFSHIFIVTNQQCVSKKLISIDELNEIHRNMLKEIELNNGKITEIFSAVERKNKKPHRRKPNTKMGQEAKEKYPLIDFSKSIMVGDTDSDIEFGRKLGMKTVRVISEDEETLNSDLRISNLLELANLLN